MTCQETVCITDRPINSDYAHVELKLCSSRAYTPELDEDRAQRRWVRRESHVTSGP